MYEYQKALADKIRKERKEKGTPLSEIGRRLGYDKVEDNLISPNPFDR